ncbi:MAG: hypothetical protein QI197_02290 [Candidatus Korarchaeota archaeon]|nr:hypothetical protein [Candidatus Korarchaeota archaeon]
MKRAGGIYKYIVVTILVLLILPPLLSIAAQPSNKDGQAIKGPTPEEMKKMDEILKKLEEEDRERPPIFIPEPNVYVGTVHEDPEGNIHLGKGRKITDENGNFLALSGRFTEKGCNATDHYWDFDGNDMYVINGNHTVFRKVMSANFAGTYFSVFDGKRCLNCDSGIQTVRDYWSPDTVKEYVESNYPEYTWFHIKYFINSRLDDYVYKNTEYVNIYKLHGELWSEANYNRSDNRWVKYGYPDMWGGGASYIVGKRLFVSVGCYYNDFWPYYWDYYYRKFGYPYIIYLFSNFGHQFLIRYVTRW